MILRIDHVSIAVRDYEKARPFFQQLMGAVAGTGAGDETMKYRRHIFSLGDMSHLELIHSKLSRRFMDGFQKNRVDEWVAAVNRGKYDQKEYVRLSARSPAELKNLAASGEESSTVRNTVYFRFAR